MAANLYQNLWFCKYNTGVSLALVLQNVELPPMLEIEAQDQRLMERWRGLNQYYIKSPYHLRGPAKGQKQTHAFANPTVRTYDVTILSEHASSLA